MYIIGMFDPFNQSWLFALLKPKSKVWLKETMSAFGYDSSDITNED
jgi:hypothetical protein